MQMITPPLCLNHSMRVRVREAKIFMAAFYGLRIFCCKVVQFCATQRESEMVEAPSVRKAAQAGENARKTRS